METNVIKQSEVNGWSMGNNFEFTTFKI